MARPRKKTKAKPAPKDLGPSKALFSQHFQSGAFDKALAVSRNLIARGVKHPNVYSDAGVAAIKLELWRDAITYATRALSLDPRHLTSLDTLAHAHGALREWPKAAQAGRRALSVRDAMVANQDPSALPLSACPATADKDVIAFSLFGGSSKYCETAVLNCIDQPEIYPGWLCRFYVDDTVPDQIVTRLQDNGAEVIAVPPEMQKWPGPMWRFAAYDAPDVRRVIFRDADSVISQREAGAVRDWIASERAFHAMRDIGSHTELLLAGLWGVVKGALPSMTQMIEAYLAKPVQSAHFADQFFLRQYVWPFARRDILQHDSIFGFMDGIAFPDGPHRDDFHVGYAEGSPFLTFTSALPDGADVVWEIYAATGDDPRTICRYPGVIRDSKLQAHVPARYVGRLQSKEWALRLDKA
ncbi:tetratricopeptide repeat protein [Roseovarius sp.]|jgi:hypothetical protein